MRKLLIILLLFSFIIDGTAIPPKPPLGKRWVLNETFSDEFNGTSIDHSKWFDYHPSWKGREPGLFLSSQVKVKDGYMTIRGEKMKKDTVIRNWNGTTSTYNIKCGAVVSRTQDASYGYYECRVKANKTTMSTTFWMSTRKNYSGPETCNDRYGLELDFQECIGREGNFSGSYFAKGMHSNSHFWYTDCSGKKQDLRATSVNYETPVMPSDTFYTYGGWWKDASRVSFFLNDKEIGSHQFNASIKTNPFDQKMGLNMVSETYPFPWISLPTDTELADPEKNICYYDWVRSYILLDVDQARTGQKTVMFNEAIHFEEKPVSMTNEDNFTFPIRYMANEHREIHLSLYDSDHHLLAEKVFSALAGYGLNEYMLHLSSALKDRASYIIQAHIRPLGAPDNTTAFSSDEYTFVVKDPIDISFIIKDARLGTPLSDARILFNTISVESNDSGKVILEDVKVDSHSIKVSRKGYESKLFPSLYLSSDTTISLALTPKIYRFYLYVKDSANNIAFKGQFIEVNEESYRTNNYGFASLALPYGVHSVSADVLDYNYYMDNIFNDGENDVTIYLTKTGTSIKNAKKAKCSIYPNPAHQQIHVTNCGWRTGYKIISLSGLLKDEGVLPQNTMIDISSLKDGVYFLQIHSGNNNEALRFQVIH